MPNSPCPCFRCGVLHDGNCDSSDADLGCFGGGRCLICGGMHLAHMACPCHRCGLRHDGDCASVCSRCLRCHRPNQSDCTQHHIRVTNDRRVRARTQHNDDACSLSNVQRDLLGDMNVQCPFCRARFFPQEKLNCCHGGDIVIPELNDVPTVMSDIILCSHVRQHMRAYNSAMAFASTGHENHSLVDGTFVLGGRSYHRIGSILPLPVQQHSFSQIYVLDTDDATHRRLELMPALRAHTLSQLHDLMIRFNRLAVMYRTVVCNIADFEVHNDAVGYSWSGSDELSMFEVGAVIERDGFKRHIVLKLRDGLVRSISDSHQLYHALTYPLLFPTGCSGWHAKMEYNGRLLTSQF